MAPLLHFDAFCMNGGNQILQRKAPHPHASKDEGHAKALIVEPILRVFSRIRNIAFNFLALL